MSAAVPRSLKIIAALIGAVLVGGLGAVWGATVGVFAAEAAVWAGLAAYGSTLPDAEVDLWIPFAAFGAVFGLLAALIVSFAGIAKVFLAGADR